MLNYKVILRILGFVLLLFSGFMLVPLICALIYSETVVYDFLYSFLICAGLGALPIFLLRVKNNEFGKREGFLIVVFSWLLLSLAGSIPYLFSETLNNFTDAFFESTSGFTTTGASVFTDIEALPKSVLLWRSITQWIGGMGIIVLTVALLPLLGVSGIELFVAEAPGPKSEKIHPKIQGTAKRLWFIYLGLTGILIALLFAIGGMNFFDAINHGLTTMSTGGFSTKNTSIAHYDSPLVQYLLIIFMILAGMNYTILYFGFKGKLKKMWSSDEFRAYLILLVFLIVACSFWIYHVSDSSFEKSFRDAAFQVVSIITTTGFVSADYTSWNQGLTLLFFFMFFAGACAGSTSGGIKVIRHLTFSRNALLEFKRMLHPRAVIRLKLDGKLVSPKILTHLMVFLLIYAIIFVFGTVIMGLILHDNPSPLLTALGSVATCLGNVGPGIGDVGPVDNFAAIPNVGKNFLCFLMITGRLELFTVLILFTPYFWKSN